MINLHASSWAPRSSRTREVQKSNLLPAQRHAVTRQEEYERFSKLLFRLRWKANHLLVSQQQVLIHHEPHVEGAWIFTSTAEDAETMFKVDFFEFYILLERAIIHLLAVFAIVVSASTPFDVEVEANGNQLVGDSNVFSRATHSFHHNVLQALDKTSNPLHNVLGVGEVREYLAIAKEFRNRWKDAEERPSLSSSPDRGGRRQTRYERLLRELKLGEMLECIFNALTVALRVAEEECQRESKTKGTEFRSPQSSGTEDMPWESMPDAMDWS
jgi:hypothetical protein